MPPPPPHKLKGTMLVSASPPGESNPEITKARDEFKKDPKISRLVESDLSPADRVRLTPDQKAANNAKDDDLKCVFFRGLQGLYLEEGIEDALRSVAKNDHSRNCAWGSDEKCSAHNKDRPHNTGR